MSDQRRPDAAPADPRLDAAWRAASREEPPSRVDDAILAAARAAVRDAAPTRPSSAIDPWWRRWQPLAAAAAVTGLAFVLLQSLPRDEPVQAPSVTPEARNEDRSPSPASASSPVRSPEADAAPPGQSTTVAAPTASAEPVAKARQESVLAEQAVGGVAAQATIATDVTPVAAERPALPAARATLQGLAGPRSADAWVSQIVDRHAAGDLDAAAADLRAFRAAYPDADSHLPESLRAWAATVTSPEAP
jgi:hypothetical protein